MDIISILAFVSAIAATVLAFIFIVPAKKREKLNGIGKFLHDTLNFKYLIIEKILQAMYIFATAFAILTGFFLLFYFEESYSWNYGARTEWYGGYGLMVMILGPIALRIVYEASIMLILLVKNVIQINNKLSGDAKDVFAVPGKDVFGEKTAAPAAPAAPVAPAEPVCRNCGAKLAEGAVFCAKCGTKN